MAAAETSMEARLAAITASINESRALLASCARGFGVKEQERQAATTSLCAATTTSQSAPGRLLEQSADRQVWVSHQKPMCRPQPWPSFACNRLEGVQMMLARLAQRRTQLELSTGTMAISSSDCIDEVSSHQEPLDDISSSDVKTSSIESELLLCSVNQSCDDHIDDDEYCYPGSVQGNTPENIKAVEESSPIDEFNTMQSDSCGSTQRNCTSLEQAVQMQAEGQLDSVVCHGVGTKDMLLHMNVEQAATDYHFTFDKTLDFFVGVSDSAVILSPSVEANAAHDSQLFSANDMEGSSKDMNQLNCAMNRDICGSVNDQVSIKDFGFQHQLFQACVDMDKSGCVTSESSSVSKEIQEIPAGTSNPIVTHQKTNAQTKKSEFYIGEESIQEQCDPSGLNFIREDFTAFTSVALELHFPWDPGVPWVLDAAFNMMITRAMEATCRTLSRQGSWCNIWSYHLRPPDHAIAWGQAIFFGAVLSHPVP